MAASAGHRPGLRQETRGSARDERKIMTARWETTAGDAPVRSAQAPEESVRVRYTNAARERETALCCSVSYSDEYLAAIPAEIVERDYGCGDPTPYVRPGDTVLDLGSGGGKLCYIAAQIVGRGGRIIGVDCNREMLALARRHRQAVAERLGYSNVEFRCGMIQDLALDLDRLADELSARPAHDVASWLELRDAEERLRREAPMVADASVDCVLSNCVLNLVRPRDRAQLFQEVHRVLKPGGRAAISDIVSERDVPDELARDPELWSGCISGAYREDRFVRAFEQAGFHGIRFVKRDPRPWRVVAGIAFRSVTVLAYKQPATRAAEERRALIYTGPFRSIIDDEGRSFARGEQTAVSDSTFAVLRGEPYAGMFLAVDPETAHDAAPCHTTQGPARATEPSGNPLATLPVTGCCASKGRETCC
jgi:arsenite methyltransferase